MDGYTLTINVWNGLFGHVPIRSDLSEDAPKNVTENSSLGSDVSLTKSPV